jgi:hypothetical protein
MKKNQCLLGAALGIALLVTGCESDGSSRVQEKSAVYATLKPWQKKYIDTGVIAMGFTPDMVYMAIGNPTEKKPADGGELWIFKNYYPSVAADQNKRALNTETAMDHTLSGGMQMEASGRPTFSVRTQQSISTTGGMQGGSLEPADLQSYTLWVTFRNGVVTRMKLDLN